MPLSEALSNEVRSHITEYPNFPAPGVLFRDVFPLFTKPGLIDRLCKSIAEEIHGKVDVIAGLEARGFLFGPIIATHSNLPFIPIRKKGKLPGRCLSVAYQKEYAPDIVEIQVDSLSSGQRVLLVDDLLATGGTLSAAIQLINEAGANVTEIAVIIELLELKGREKLPSDINYLSVVTYG